MSDIKILTSPSGERMLGYVSPLYYQSKVMLSIFQANGREFDDINTWCEEIKLQIFPQTATWGLKYWEDALDIITNEALGLEIRRQKVISKIVTKTPVNPAKMKSILEQMTKLQVDIDENVADYTFGVKFYSKEYSNIVLEQITKAIKSAKPSHLSFDLTINYVIELTLNILFSRWTSELIPQCGTFDSSGNPVKVTDGWSFEEVITNTFDKYLSEKLLVASETTYSTGQGYSIIQYISNLFSRFFSEPFLICSEDTFITSSGRSFNSSLINTHEAYLSEPMPACSEILYSIGGVLEYDS